MIKRATGCIVSFVLFLVLFELGSYLLWKKYNGIKDYKKFYYDYSRIGRKAEWRQSKVEHPFFGYVVDCETKKRTLFCNSSLFNSKEEVPKTKNNEEFVLGVFGGSVADSLYEYVIADATNKRMKNIKASLGLNSKKLRLLNFSNGGYKQPQQSQIAFFYLESLDGAIVIDGFNEINGLPLSDHPNTFPHSMLRSDQFLNILLVNIVNILKDFYLNLSQFGLNNSLLARTSSFHSAWRLIEFIYGKSFFSLNRRIKNQHGLEELKRNPHLMDDNFRISSWIRNTKKMILLFKKFDKPIWHFIQPNQYFENSKVFTTSERELAFVKDVDRASRRKKSLNRLKKFYDMSLKEKFPSHSLDQIFKNTKESVYIDDCCHLNDLGNEIMLHNINLLISNSRENNES